MRVSIALALFALVASGPVVRGQAAEPGDVPPLLSTEASAPPGSTADPSGMSGMPLQVGDLPPGIVAVRVIRGTFAENVANQPVELHFADESRILNAKTTQDGRARFSGVAVGSTVAVRAVVDGRPLLSRWFAIPSRGGVRLILSAGDAEATVGNVAPEPSRPVQPNASAPAAAEQGLSAAAVAAFLLVFLAIGVAVLWFSPGRRRSWPGASDSTVGPAGRS